MNTNIEYYMALPYTWEVVPDDGDGLWFAEIKELEVCMTQAESWQALHPMVLDAMHGWLEVSIETGMAIPEPERVTS